MREKRFLHFCSQWPWPLDLKFAPYLLLSSALFLLN